VAVVPVTPDGHSELFHRFARWTEHISGHPLAFVVAVASVVTWAATGPLFHFSDTWQLVINTSTTIVTFLMVFLIQSSQNRKSDALQLKVDELIRALRPAHNALLDLEERTEGELTQLKEHYRELAEHSRGPEDERRPRAAERKSPPDRKNGRKPA
jgi:low affinity Fe/Cu permease